MNSYWDKLVVITRQLPKERLAPLTVLSDWYGWLDVTVTWGIIAGCFTAVAYHPAWYVIGAAIILLGGRQLALAVLMHEAAHRTLFRSRKLNDFVGQWLCSYPIWNDLNRYREEHLQHHFNTGLESDPDRGLTTPFPTTQQSFLRKVGRDLLGQSGLRRVVGLWKMDWGYLTYSNSTNAKLIDQTNRNPRLWLLMGLTNISGMVITNLALFGGLLLVGHPWLYMLWLVSYFTTFSLFLRLRAIAEHAATPDQANPLLNTRTTLAGPLARLTLAPHHVNYHLEHHLFFSIPHYRLPALHRLLHEQGLTREGCIARSYRAVLADAVKKPQS